MSDGKCVIGPEVKIIERRSDHWILDNGLRIDDISKCKILPSPHERRIILQSGEKKTVPSKKSPPPPIVNLDPRISVPSTPRASISIPQQSITPPNQTIEEILVVDDNMMEKIQELVGDNIVSALMLVGYAIYKNALDNKKKQKSEDESDQKCKGRHLESSQQYDDISSRIEELKEEISKYTEGLEYERNKYASKRALSDMNDKISEMNDKVSILEGLLDNHRRK